MTEFGTGTSMKQLMILFVPVFSRLLIFTKENTTNIPADITAHISTIIYIGDIIHNPYLVPREKNYQNSNIKHSISIWL